MNLVRRNKELRHITTSLMTSS